jgi:predicted acetyltransferase
MRAKLILRLPRQDEEQELLSAYRATAPSAPYFLHHYAEGMPFARYLEILAEQARGIGVPANYVPSSTIEKNGGLLENVITLAELEKPKRRYWIETR